MLECSVAAQVALFVEVAWWDAGMLGRSPCQRPVWLKQASAAQASGPFSCMVVMESRMADWVGRSGAAQASGPVGWRCQPSHGHLPINIWGVWAPKVSIWIMWFPCVCLGTGNEIN